MAHEIYNEKFISVRQPAWHGLGLVLEEGITPTKAGELLGVPDVYTETIVTTSGLEVPSHKAIIGKDEKGAVCYSVVSQYYEEVTHKDFILAFEEATHGSFLETIGLLGKGERLFLTTKLESFDLKGDEVTNYLMGVNVLTGSEANLGTVSSVRTVCQNTLNAAIRRASQTFRVNHFGKPKDEMKAWLKEIWETSKDQSETVKEAYRILAEATVKRPTENAILGAAYPKAERPNVDERTDLGLDKLAAWQRHNERQEAHINEVRELFHGKAVGWDLPSAKGTAWGLYNAVAEYEDHHRKFRTSNSTVFGDGKVRKQAAFDKALALIKG